MKTGLSFLFILAFLFPLCALESAPVDKNLSAETPVLASVLPANPPQTALPPASNAQGSSALGSLYELALIDQQAPKTVPFAQPFALQFSLAHTPGYGVDVNKETLPAGFALTQLNAAETSPGTLTYDFTAVAFTLGISTFTAVTFELVDTNKKVLATTKSQPIFLQVTPVNYFKDKQLKEIRPPYIPTSLWGWISVLLVLVLLVVAVRHFLKHARQQAGRILDTQDARPSDEIALSKIDALLDSGLWEQQEYKLFYITLSDICREYLWRRFKIDASAYTSDELLWRVRNVEQLAPLKIKLREFLASGDLVKFAKVIPTEPERNKDVDILKEMVQTTAPALDEPKDLIQKTNPVKTSGNGSKK